MRYYIPAFVLVCFFTAFSCRNNEEKTALEVVPDTTGLYQERFTELFLDSVAVFNFLDRHPEFSDFSNELFEFYRMRNFRFAWFNKEGMTEQASHFMNLIKSSTKEISGAHLNILDNLQPSYDKLHDPEIIYPYADSPMVEFEMMLTSSYFEYAKRLYIGLGEQTLKNLEWYIPAKKIRYSELLDSLLQGSIDSISAVVPVLHMYYDLRKHLIKYSTLLNEIKWDSISYPKGDLKQGDKNKLLPSVKTKLFYLDDLSVADTSLFFTSECEHAVKQFQERMGLKADGHINRELIDALNVPLDSRIETILLNMERCRWIPSISADKFIVINLPEFRMHVFKDGQNQWSSNVIIGQASWNTVIFTEKLKYIVFSPYWNVPNKIFVDEMLPAIKQDPDYLSKHKMEIITRSPSSKKIDPSSINWNLYPGIRFPYLIRQLPGPHNSLGGVKFLFPNSFNMYLHDTPDKSLFKEPKRTFSHGCIRVEEPLRLSEFLLRNDSSWTADSILTAMNSGKEKFVALKEEVPVIIVYFTCWVDAQGILNFRDDIYGHDQKLEHVLFEESRR